MKNSKLFAVMLLASGMFMATGCAETTRQDQATTDTTEENQTVAESDRTTEDSNSNVLSESDRDFVEEAAQDGLAEVQLGQLAAQKATNSEVKAFAQRMVQDHTKANNNLQQIAQDKNVVLPQDIGDKNTEDLEDLSKLSGADFDKAYMQNMIDNHQDTVSLFEKQAQEGDDPALQTFAENTLPTIQAHKELADSIIDKNSNLR